MAPHHWQQLKEILGDALEREGDERTTFVMERCGSDTTLRHEVESYLKNSGQTVEACAEKMREALLNKLPSEWIGHRLGAYRIVREIGRGGMGTVFLAARADGQFEKQVAIKLLKRGTDTDEIVRRFRAERQILAQLEHSSIARLIDAGTTEDGLPYFVMEFVSGNPITTYVREHRLTIQQRLELFLKVCAAVERAHHDHIVHRDLKPSNILVNVEGEPKLLDFGIAKLLEPGDDALEVTATNQQRFTPSCVSPEQTRGEPVTIATDIYSLGALLYELLTDQTPHRFSTKRPSSEELARVVCDEEPIAPSAAVSDRDIQRELHGDLDNIALCALRKEPERRYSSVNAFAEDVWRYLNKRPVEARPNTTIYRVQRFLARNRNAGFQFGLIAALLIAALVFLVSPHLRRMILPSAATSQPSAPMGEKSIAVLPFDSFNNEKDSSYFVDGVQDDILTDLAKVADLKVISRNAVSSYRGDAKKNVREIGNALGVAHVLQGSVQRSDGRVRVNAQLIDTRTNAQVWAESYERKVDDLFALQSELAQAIVAQLKATLSPSERAAIESRPTQDMVAYDLYLKARDAIFQFASKGGVNWKEADTLLDSAIARDPKFTLAYCLQSKANVNLYRYIEHTPERLARAEKAAAKAMELAPDLADSHLALAEYYYNGFRDYARAQSELNIAAPALKGNAEFLVIAQVTERRLGRWKDAVRDGEKAVTLNPGDPIYVGVLLETYNALRKYSEMDLAADKAIARLPAESTSSIWGHKVDSALARGELVEARNSIHAAPNSAEWKDSMLAQIAYYERRFADAAQLYAKANKSQKQTPLDAFLEAQTLRWLSDPEKSRQAWDRARQTAEEALRNRPEDPNLSGFLAIAHAGLGNKTEALKIAQAAVDRLPVSADNIDGVNCIVMLAEVNALLGNADAALTELAKVVNLPNGPTYGDLRDNAEWDGLRKDSRFEKILTRSMSPPDYE
jgi:serine/threonine protein kinase